MNKKKKIALFYPWLHLYGGGEVLRRILPIN